MYDESMIKLLPVALVLVLMVGALLYLRFFWQSAPENSGKPIVELPLVSQISAPKPTAAVGSDDRIKVLEESMALLAKELNSLKSPNKSTQTNPASQTEAKIQSLESTIADLQKQLNEVKSTSQTVSSKKSPLYITLGAGGSTGDKNWYDFDSYQLSLDPADYPGYTSIQLEVTAKLSQSSGTGSVRLFNSTDNLAISSSDTSTTSDKYTLMVSGSFKLSGGKKTYRLQAKSDQGFEFYIQNARLKVNF